MYNVYMIFLKDFNAVYVGCTNNLRRRKDQHNENSRKKHGRFGAFLNQNNIILRESDFVILKKIEDRKEALKLERKTVLSFNKTDMNVLNDNYSLNCSRDYGIPNQILNAEYWVVVDFINHTFEEVYTLKKYCEEKKLDYKGLHGSSSKTHSYKNQFKAFKLEDWNKLSDRKKQFYISGKFLKQISKKILENHVKRMSKSYIVIFPNGSEEVVTNLDKFAREHNINGGNLHSSIKTGKKANGYIAKNLD